MKTTKKELVEAIEHAKKLGVNVHMRIYSGTTSSGGIMSLLNQQLGRLATLIKYLPEDEK